MRAGASYHLSMLQRPPLIRQYIHHSLTRGPPPLSFPHVQQMRSNQNIIQDLTLEIVVRNMKWQYMQIKLTTNQEHTMDGLLVLSASTNPEIPTASSCHFLIHPLTFLQPWPSLSPWRIRYFHQNLAPVQKSRESDWNKTNHGTETWLSGSRPPTQCSGELVRNDKFYRQATIMGPNGPI